ncbi:hypothetical protein [Clostridium taeniosporum]|uniref:hypothetical protein n=1 Tax=Clostridium taeniosporum TaxID=394958 RepID=UPI0013142C5C|nr:hypothetical protein [Clostridium taeniosporum]
MLDKLLMEYEEKFQDNYPIRSIPCDWQDEQIMDSIKKCIKENKPFEVEYDEKADY